MHPTEEVLSLRPSRLTRISSEEQLMNHHHKRNRHSINNNGGVGIANLTQNNLDLKHEWSAAPKKNVSSSNGMHIDVAPSLSAPTNGIALSLCHQNAKNVNGSNLNKELIQKLRDMTKNIKTLSDENVQLRNEKIQKVENSNSKLFSAVQNGHHHNYEAPITNGNGSVRNEDYYRELSRTDFINIISELEEKVESLQRDVDTLRWANSSRPSCNDDENTGTNATPPCIKDEDTAPQPSKVEKDKYKALARRLKDERNYYKEACQEKIHEQEVLTSEMEKMSELIAELRNHCHELQADLIPTNVQHKSEQREPCPNIPSTSVTATQSIKSSSSLSNKQSLSSNCSIATLESSRRAKSVYGRRPKVAAIAPLTVSNRPTGSNARIVKPVTKPPPVAQQPTQASPSRIPSRLPVASPSRIPICPSTASKGIPVRNCSSSKIPHKQLLTNKSSVPLRKCPSSMSTNDIGNRHCNSKTPNQVRTTVNSCSNIALASAMTPPRSPVRSPLPLPQVPAAVQQDTEDKQLVSPSVDTFLTDSEDPIKNLNQDNTSLEDETSINCDVESTENASFESQHETPKFIPIKSEEAGATQRSKKRNDARRIHRTWKHFYQELEERDSASRKKSLPVELAKVPNENEQTNEKHLSEVTDNNVRLIQACVVGHQIRSASLDALEKDSPVSPSDSSSVSRDQIFTARPWQKKLSAPVNSIMSPNTSEDECELSAIQSVQDLLRSHAVRQRMLDQQDEVLKEAKFDSIHTGRVGNRMIVPTRNQERSDGLADEDILF